MAVKSVTFTSRPQWFLAAMQRVQKEHSSPISQDNSVCSVLRDQKHSSTLLLFVCFLAHSSQLC